MVARTAPAILKLLGDGTPRPKSAIITALADRHPKEDVTRTLMRLAVTGQLAEANRKYSLGPAQETGEGQTDPEPCRLLRNGKYPHPASTCITKPVRVLLSGTLQHSPAARPSLG
jgi:hypothetical protein